MKKIKLGVVLVGALLSFFLIGGEFAQAEHGVTKDEILIGSTLDMSGPLAFLGQSIRDGANLYFRYINEQGGINGRKIKWIIEDDGFQSPRALQGAKKLVTKDDVFCMTMNLGATNISAMMPVLEENNVPLLPAGTANEQLTTPPRKYIFLSDTGYIVQGSLAVQYMMTELKAKNQKVAVIYQDDLTGQQWLAGVKAACEKYGIKDVLELSFKRGAVDFSTQIAKCKQSDITHIFHHTNVREPAIMMKEAQRIQYKAFFITNATSGTQKVLELAGDAVDYTNGYYCTASVHAPLFDDTKSLRLYKDLIKKYNLGSIDNNMNMWAFQCAITLCEVLQRSGKDLTRENFIKAAETLKNYDNGINAPLTWSKDQRDGGRSIKIYKAEKGNWVPKTGWISQ